MQKSVAIMQPYIFPYLGYFQLIASVDEFVVYDDVNFIKKGWIHRNNILINGQSSQFNIPLIQASQNKKINEIEVANDTLWQAKLLKSIEQAYKKAPFFYETFDLISKIINHPQINLAQFITYSLKEICQYLALKTKIIESSSVFGNESLKAQNRIIDICQRLNATHYINAIGGKELYDFESFMHQNIQLKFIKSNPIVYKQFKNEFVNHLSIIDVLMFNSSAEIAVLLQSKQLID